MSVRAHVRLWGEGKKRRKKSSRYRHYLSGLQHPLLFLQCLALLGKLLHTLLQLFLARLAFPLLCFFSGLALLLLLLTLGGRLGSLTLIEQTRKPYCHGCEQVEADMLMIMGPIGDTAVYFLRKRSPLLPPGAPFPLGQYARPRAAFPWPRALCAAPPSLPCAPSPSFRHAECKNKVNERKIPSVSEEDEEDIVALLAIDATGALRCASSMPAPTSRSRFC